MRRQEVLNRLRRHETELREAGIVALYLFGSTARGDARNGSDVDLACDVDEAKQLSLLQLGDVQQSLETILASDVDLVEREWLHPTIRQRVTADMIQVF